MKKLLGIVVLGLLLSISVKADDIRDFQIEDISLYDSALKHFSKTKIDNSKKVPQRATSQSLFLPAAQHSFLVQQDEYALSAKRASGKHLLFPHALHVHRPLFNINLPPLWFY